VLVTCLVFLVTGTGWGATVWLDRQLRDVLALDPDSDSITDAGAQRGDENILLVGSDTRTGAQQHDNVGDATVVGGARSDTVMIAHLPADLSRVVIVSFPRDLEIWRPPCALWDPVSGSYTEQQDPGASFVIDGAPLPGEAPADGPTGAAPPDGTSGAQTPAAAPPVTGITPTTGSPTTGSPTPAPSAVQVRVLNGAAIPGVAGRASQELQEAGFGVLEVGDSTDRVRTTTIRYPPAREAEALTLLAALPDAVLQSDQAITDAVVLVIGPDFDGVIPSDTTPTPPSPGTQLNDLTTVNAADTACS
jgi:hypothetical protein